MSNWKVTEVDGDRERADLGSRTEAEEVKEEMEKLGMNVEIVPPEASPDGGETKTAEVVDDDETTEQLTNAPKPQGGYDLPDKPRVDQDPLTWMPDEFTDTIEGTVAINRKGFEVLCQHFGVSIKPEVEVSPHETDFEYAQCRAVATTEDGTEYAAYGSAHVDRGDDSTELLEMADTRSYKRAASRATGVGMLAVEEIQNSVGNSL